MALVPRTFTGAATRWPRFLKTGFNCSKVIYFALFLKYFGSPTSMGSLGLTLILTLPLDLPTAGCCFSCLSFVCSGFPTRSDVLVLVLCFSHLYG